MAENTIDENILKQIPQKYHCMIASLAETEDTDPSTENKIKAYRVILNNGFTTIDSNSEFTAFSISSLNLYFRNNVRSTDTKATKTKKAKQKPAAPVEVIPSEDTSIVVPERHINEHLAALDNAVGAVKDSFITICLELSWFDKTQNYTVVHDVTGRPYFNIVDFANDRYGFKKATTYQYIAVAESFGKKDAKGYITDIQDEYKEYGITQLIAMKGLDSDHLQQCNPDMKVNDIKKIAADYKNGNNPENSNNNPDSSGPTENPDNSGNDRNSSGSTIKVKMPNTQELYSFTSAEDLENRKDEIFNTMKRVMEQGANGIDYGISILMTW